MNTADASCVVRKGPKLVITLLIINFLLLILAMGPGSSRDLYIAMKRAGISDLLGHLFQVWVVGSTLVATITFPVILCKNWNMPAEAAIRGVALAGTLLLLWWLALFGIFVYGSALGAGG